MALRSIQDESNKKKHVPKTIFDSPLHIWPKLQEKDSLEIVQLFLKYSLSKERLDGVFFLFRKLRDLNSSSSSSQSDHQKRKQRKAPPDQSSKTEKCPMKNPTDVPALASNLILGINDTTRKIPGGKLSLLFVFKSDIHPSLLVEHYPMMCKFHQVLLIPIIEISDSDKKFLKDWFGVKRLSVIGIPRSSNYFDDLVALSKSIIDISKDETSVQKRKWLPLLSHIDKPKRTKL